MKRFIQYIIAPLMALAATGCQDDFMKQEIINEGKAKVSATIDFKPMSASLARTKTAGDALKDINSLHVLLYDEESKLINKWKIEGYTVSDENRTDADAENNHKAEETTKHATFNLPEEIAFGKYYMYAVANIPDSLINQNYSEAIKTVDGLKNISLAWDSENIATNGQMIGLFTNTSSPSLDESITLNASNTKLHAWLRRAASKVTIAYDGTQLNDGVSIYIMAASIKDIPKSCPLGMPNTPNHIDSLIHDGGMIQYFTNDIIGEDGFIKDGFQDCYEARISSQKTKYGSDHSETADALFFYENRQGAGESMPDKRQDANQDGGLDHPGLPGDATYRLKDDVPCGSYIEVDAIYRSENPGKPGVGIIKYRFMLGQDVINDYNATRNCHYKLTLNFKGYGNDVDWHIEYKQQVLEVTEPKVMNYQGKVFIPEYRPETQNYNYGHHFEDNTITVTSYIEQNETPVKWTMEIDEGDGKGYKPAEKSEWFTPVVTDGYLPYIKHVRFEPKSLNKEEIDIDDLLRNATQKGSEAAPYNLANPGQTVDPASATIKCTANCYIVDAPGYYILPLVYGNAYHNFQANTNAYTYTGSYTGDQILPTFKDYLGNEITSPFIKGTTSEYTPQSAFLVWQDENKLVSYTVWNPTADIKYLPKAYGGKGGILFRVERDNIKQGNAVIGVSNAMKESGNTNIPPVMWSWHIWVTNFSYLEKDDKNIEVTSHNPSQKFKLLPVNLGWCSDHGDKIKYYKARKCTVKFTAGELVQTIELEQKSHIAFTRGNNTYYQWGRKDPFVCGTGEINPDPNASNGINKTRYYSEDWYATGNPDMFFAYNAPDGGRYTTREAVNNGALIQNPRLWHNPRRKENPAYKDDKTVYPYLSDNEIYRNLWQGRIEVTPGSLSLKTVYDPCPVGYQVPHYTALSGFTTTGDNTNTPFEWYDVRVENIADYDPATGSCGENGKYSKGLFEFYTNPDKLQSIIFPETGYRDWDDYSNIYQININGPIGYIWTAGNKNGEGGSSGDDNNSYNFEFARKDYAGSSYIRPKNYFYPCDGMPIRPCIYDSHNTTTP